MSESTLAGETPSNWAARCHWLLLRLAGSAPDGLLHHCRRLAAADPIAVGRAITFSALTYGMPLPAQDLELLAELLEADGTDPGVLSLASARPQDREPMFAFTTEAQQDEPALAAMLAAMAPEAGDVGLWRSWRTPLNDGDWPYPRWVWVLEVDETVELADRCGMLARTAEAVGDESPAIEVYPTGAHVPAYQWQARAAGELIWARAQFVEPRLAMVYDGESDGRYLIAPDHPKLSVEDAQRVLGYLTATGPLLEADRQLTDVAEPGRGEVVPADLFTDGLWVWSGASQYYLDKYGYSPPSELLERICRHDGLPPVVDGPTAHRIRTWLSSAHSEPLRTEAEYADK